MGTHTLDPRVARSRAAIVEAASEHFLRYGYVAANVDGIAVEAGVSKRTVYNVFGGKERLFREILAGTLDTAARFSEGAAVALTAADDVEAALRTTAVDLARIVLSEQVVRLRRLLIGEAARFPELARDYYACAPGQVMARIAQALRALDERGLLSIEDPDLAAEHLAFLVLGASLDRALFEVQAPAPEQVEARALAGVEVFLRAYGARR